MPYTYPPAAPSISGDNVTISRFLNNPTLVARRLRTLLEQRYISDAILSGRFTAEGGSIQYETGETIFSDDAPRAVGPGSEYPLTSVSSGTASLAKTVNWGQDALITDAAISRQRMNPVTRALTKLANQNVKYVDSIALSAVSSAVTQTMAAGTGDGSAANTWVAAATTASDILTDVMAVKANVAGLNQGFDLDTVVISDMVWAMALAKFVAAGYFPRENAANNPALTGEFPVIAGLRWLPTPNLPVANAALVVDSTQLGGMADEDLGGPGYVSAGGVGVQAKTMRDDERDQWRLRCRRVTVPVVLEPNAAYKITAVS